MPPLLKQVKATAGSGLRKDPVPKETNVPGTTLPIRRAREKVRAERVSPDPEADLPPLKVLKVLSEEDENEGRKETGVRGELSKGEILVPFVENRPQARRT